MSVFAPLRTVPFVVLALTACGGPPSTTATTTPARTSDSADRRPSAATTASTGGDSGACTLESVYFTYDSNNIEGGARSALANDAACLRARPEENVILVGGADERGTEEYNLSLGDRRARAVRVYLTDSGVDAGRMSVSTMGEEWASGTDESAMARDRRVDARTRR